MPTDKWSFLIRVLWVVAIAVTALFALSTLFSFGASTHCVPRCSWHSSRPGIGIFQLYFGDGQFHLLADLAPPSQPIVTTERGYYAGAYLSPALRFDLRKTDRYISKLGFDGFAVRNGTYLSCGAVGLYPALLAWLALWLVVRHRPIPAGFCHNCRYETRHAPRACPECGALPKKTD
jgi:hypothetical protein